MLRCWVLDSGSQFLFHFFLHEIPDSGGKKKRTSPISRVHSSRVSREVYGRFVLFQLPLHGHAHLGAGQRHVTCLDRRLDPEGMAHGASGRNPKNGTQWLFFPAIRVSPRLF